MDKLCKCFFINLNFYRFFILPNSDPRIKNLTKTRFKVCVILNFFLILLECIYI